MKKTLSILSCLFLVLGLMACSSTEKNEVAKQPELKQEETNKKEPETVKKEDPQQKEDKMASMDKMSLADLDKFQMFDTEYQLAIVVALFNKVILVYDYGIGNADYLLRDKMTQGEIDNMKKVLQEQAKASNKQIKDMVYQSQTLLQKVNISNKEDMQKLLNAENNYLQKVDEMILCLDSVTVANTQESRAKMNQLKQEYLQSASEIGLASVDIAQGAGLNVALYRDIVSGLLKN
jgi:hypothetical protein